MFTGVARSDSVRKESQNSVSGTSVTGSGNAKLMRTHKMQTKSGEPIEVYFGYDSMSLNSRSISYGDVVFWSHSASHFTMTYLSKQSGRRKDIVMYPVDKGPKPSDLTEMLSVRIARLVADQTGCSEEKAMRMATAKANDEELKEAGLALDEQQKLGELRSGKCIVGGEGSTPHMAVGRSSAITEEKSREDGGVGGAGATRGGGMSEMRNIEGPVTTAAAPPRNLATHVVSDDAMQDGILTATTTPDVLSSSVVNNSTPLEREPSLGGIGSVILEETEHEAMSTPLQ